MTQPRRDVGVVGPHMGAVQRQLVGRIFRRDTHLPLGPAEVGECDGEPVDLRSWGAFGVAPDG